MGTSSEKNYIFKHNASNLNYNENGYVVQASPISILPIWYQQRYNILVSSKKLKIGRLTAELRRVEARMVVCDNRDAIVQLLKESDNEETSLKLLQENYGLTLFQAHHIVETSLRILIASSRIELEKRKTDLELNLTNLRESFGNIPDEISIEALALKKKYPTPRRTKIQGYIGYVRIGNGCIQFDHVDEIPSIIEAFPKETLEIFIYNGPYHCRVTENGKLEAGSISKVTIGDIYGIHVDLKLNPRSDKVITVNITDGTACCVKGFVPGLRKEGYFYTTPMSRAISRNGVIETIDVIKTISLRKTICRGAMTDIIYVYPDPKKTHYVLALNSNTPNVVAIQKVSPEKSKISINPTGTVYLVHSVEKHFFLNIPVEYRNRNSTRVVEFLNIDALLNGNNHARIDIATMEAKKNKYIRLL